MRLTGTRKKHFIRKVNVRVGLTGYEFLFLRLVQMVVADSELKEIERIFTHCLNSQAFPSDQLLPWLVGSQRITQIRLSEIMGMRKV